MLMHYCYDYNFLHPPPPFIGDRELSCQSISKSMFHYHLSGLSLICWIAVSASQISPTSPEDSSSLHLSSMTVRTGLRSTGSTKARPFLSSLQITTDLQAQRRSEIQRRLQELQATVMQSEASLPPTNLTPDSLSPGARGGDEQMEELRRTITQLEGEIARLQPPAYEQPEVER